MRPLKQLLRPRSISQRFALAIGTGAGLILIVLAGVNYFNGRELLLEQTSSEALKEVHDEMRAMDDLVERIAMLPYVIGATQSTKKLKVTTPWLASLLEYCPISAVYGLYMVLDAGDWRDPASDIWVDRKSWPEKTQLKYDFHDPSQDWYHGARSAKGLHVTQPYYDEGGSDIDMISITQPVYRQDGSFIGVAGVDVALDEMRKIVRKMHIRDFGMNISGDSGKIASLSTTPKNAPKKLRESAYLISSTGAIIVSPEESGDQETKPPAGREGETAAAALDELLNKGLVTSLPGIREILASPSGWLRLRDGSDKVLYWAEGRTTGWKLVLEVPYELIVGPARTLALQSAAIGGVGLLLLLWVVFFVARRVSQPITELQSIASNFEKGNYVEDAKVLRRIMKRQDELGRFASSFATMAREIRLREKRLSDWNANLERTVGERTADLAKAMGKVEEANRAMAAELAEAAAYSRAVLPERFAAGPVATDWIFVPSSQLGGDSFGYHWLDEGHLALYLIDVCGHGVSASLLSVSMVNVLRNSSLVGTDFHDPAAVLSSLNAAFPMERHNDMYSTAWYGVYSCSGASLRFACAGHPPAILMRPDGTTVQLAAKGAILGAFPDAAYAAGAAEVPPGSRLYLFSDGTYEVDRPDGPMMTYDEFSELLVHAGKPGSLPMLESAIRKEHGGGAFEDDFSLVEFRFGEGERTAGSTITLRNSAEELPRLPRFTEAFSLMRGLGAEDRGDLDVILEELVTNVLKYGGLPPGAEACTITLIIRDGTLAITVSDNGQPFDPLRQPEVDTRKGIEERPIGGLGIHFVKNLTASQHYEHRDGKNILSLTMTLRPGTAP